MQIKRIYKKNKILNDIIFSSFKEVFDYCLNDLEISIPRCDCVVYQFKILDTDEIFYITGQSKGEDSEAYMQVDFRI